MRSYRCELRKFPDGYCKHLNNRWRLLNKLEKQHDKNRKLVWGQLPQLKEVVACKSEKHR
jgi:hypothetical protein